MKRNRKLLVSVFNAQESREAVIGGGRIIDAEDPRSALGNISPRNIMEISDATLHYKTDDLVQLSTNIGEDQLLFDRAQDGLAIQKFPHEIAGKAAQASLGVASSMGLKVHPVNIIKIGVDGMNIELIREVIREIALTIDRSDYFNHCQAVPVFFIQDLKEWKKRRNDESVIRQLLDLGEFFFAENGAIDLKDYYSDVEIGEMLPAGVTTSKVTLNELFPLANFGFTGDKREVLKKMIDVSADAGAHGIMVDTRIQSKVARICFLDHPRNAGDVGEKKDKLPRHGIMSIEDAEFYCKYCHYRGIESYIAGSVQHYHAEELWKIEDLDSIAVRGAASGVVLDPTGKETGGDNRRDRRIVRHLVERLIPPEQRERD
ncbi:hypothetical protein KAW65_00040 [candidate division WOR-3 bacterium]|nr:hypothetical protein [candidate division WOR-3 bacterium]